MSMTYSTANHNPGQAAFNLARVEWQQERAATLAERQDARQREQGAAVNDYLTVGSQLPATAGNVQLDATCGLNPQVELKLTAQRTAAGKPSDTARVWIDCELGRVCICRHELPEFRVWNYAHKFANGEGRILKSELFNSIQLLGFATNRRTFNGILARGNRLYWRERGGYLYLTSWKKLASKLTRWEARYAPDHVATNRPGQRRVQLDLSGSLKEAHALIYNGWIAVKSERLGYLEISRWTLERLWGRSRRQLRSWEALVGIRTEARYAEHDDIHNPMIPAHATLCLDKNGAEFVSWQLSNRIYPANTTISNTKGQARKIRATVNQTYNSIEPADLKHGGLLRVQRTGRLYFTERSGKNGNVSPYKQIDKHLVKHGDIFTRQHYAYLTTRYSKHIYEYSWDGTPHRYALCERDRLGEQGIEFRQRRSQYRIGWVYRML